MLMRKKIIGFICSLSMLINAVPNAAAEAAAVSPVIEITSDNTANIFYDNEIAKFDVAVTGMDETAEICYNIYFKNYDAENFVSEIEPVLIKSGKRNSQNTEDEIYFDLENQKYGLYDFEVVIKRNDDVILTKTIPFAKSAKSKSQNKTFGASVHLTRYADPDTVFELMKNAGLGTARDDFNWSQYEKLKGKYNLTEKQKQTLISARKYNMDMLAIVTGENGNYLRNNYSEIPDSRVNSNGVTALDGFENYIKAFLEEPLVQDTVNRIEILNEPLGVVKNETEEEYFNAGIIYGEALKRGYSAAQKSDHKVEVGGFCLYKLGWEADYFLDGAMSVMDKPYYDALTFHDYMELGEDGDPEPGTCTPEFANWWPHLNCAVYNVKRHDEYMTGKRTAPYSGNTYNFDLKERWYTERGFSTDDKPNNTNPYYNQALNLVRSKAVLDAYPDGNLGDVFWIYDFSDDNNKGSDREDSFGIVESHADENPYTPKPAYIAISNYNSLVADAESCEKIDGVDEYEPTGGIFYKNSEKLNFVGDQKYIYKYTCPDRDVYMLWHSIGADPAYEERIEFDKIGDGEAVTYYDFWGNEISEADVYDGTSYKLTKQPYYIAVGEPVNRDSSRKHNVKYDKVIIEGNIASKEAGKNASLVITDGDLDETALEEPLYISQTVTGKNGYFSFVAEIPTRLDTCNAYIVSEDNNVPIAFTVDPKRVKSVKLLLVSNMIKLEGANLPLLDINDTKAVLEYSTGTEGMDYDLYFAMYDGERLAGLEKASGSAAGNTDAEVVYSISAKKNIEYDRVSVFLWKPDSTIIPLCEAVTVWK